MGIPEKVQLQDHDGKWIAVTCLKCGRVAGREMVWIREGDFWCYLCADHVSEHWTSEIEIERKGKA